MLKDLQDKTEKEIQAMYSGIIAQKYIDGCIHYTKNKQASAYRQALMDLDEKLPEEAVCGSCEKAGHKECVCASYEDIRNALLKEVKTAIKDLLK